MSVQEVWFAQSSYPNANSNDENLTCTSVPDSHLRQNVQGVNQNIIHYVDMMYFFYNTPPYSAHSDTHTHTHTSSSSFFGVFFWEVMWSLCWSLSLGCALTHPAWLAGPCSVPIGPEGLYRTPACWTGRDLSWVSVFSVVPASWWLGAAALIMKL